MRFVLVHGAWHDGSCWAPVVVELAHRGHSALAVDLPSARPGFGAHDYAVAVEDALATAVESGESAVPGGSGEPGDSGEFGESAEAGERLVLVGHSLGGLTVPVVAQRLGPRRVAAMVFIGALLPQPGSSFDDQVRADPGIMAEGFGRGQQRHDDRTTSWPPDAAAAGLYRGVAAESSDELVAAAASRLRPQAWAINHEATPLSAWPQVPTTVVVCAADRVVASDRLRARARTLPDTELVELPGGHFPMLTRPAELADVLISAAPSC